MDVTIAASDIVKSFGEKKVLDGISFNVIYKYIKKRYPCVKFLVNTDNL